MESRITDTKTPLPEVKIESDGRNTDTMQDHTDTRVSYKPRGVSEKIQVGHF